MKRRSVRGPASRSPPARARDARTQPTPAHGPRFEVGTRLLPWLGGLGIAALLWSCRGYRPGVPVADDYSFLARLEFQKPLDPFDSMGASYYWRPLSRQLYFSLVGPWLLAAPWVDALIHALLLGAIGVLVFRVTRRELAPSVAAAIAAGVVIAEPARVLLG